MRRTLTEAWPFAAIAAAGVAVFFIVRLLLPTGETALPPLPVPDERPPPVFSVALPAPPEPEGVQPEDEVVVVAQPVSRPVVVAPQSRPRTPAASRPKAKAAPKVKVAPEEQPTEPTRVLASVARPAAPNPSPGRAKHGKGPPPGRAKKAEKQKPKPAPVAAESVPVPPATPNPSPGREKHDKGLPPGQERKG